MATTATVYAALKRLSGAALLMVAAAAGAQAPDPRNEDEIFGAAAVAPDSVRQVAKRLVTHCASLDPSLQAPGDQAVKVWEERHQRYLDESSHIRTGFMEVANNPGTPVKTKKAIKAMFELELPKMVNRQFNAMVAPINALATRQAKADLCRDYFQYILAGKLDLRSNDPGLASFLDRKIAEAGKVKR